MIDACRYACCVIGMYDGCERSRHPAHPRLVVVRSVQAKKIDRALVEVVRLAIWPQSPEEARNHVHELRQLPVPVAQCLLRGHEVVNVDRHATPQGDVARVVTQWLSAALDPPMKA